MADIVANPLAMNRRVAARERGDRRARPQTHVCSSSRRRAASQKRIAGVIRVDQLADDGFGEHLGERWLAAASDFDRVARGRRGARIEDAARLDDFAIRAEAGVVFARVIVGEPVAAGVLMGTRRAAMQRADDHVIEDAPAMLRQVDALAADDPAEQPMRQDPIDDPDLALARCWLARPRQCTPPGLEHG
jgi:hypothetical protein